MVALLEYYYKYMLLICFCMAVVAEIVVVAIVALWYIALVCWYEVHWQ